ncbi:MAG: iron-sulfur cluster assembly protein, partial [Chloroflexi bacterium]|nr:iron-sulfur cluster assembly protein [Chloroflexota bacterium]
MGGGSGLTAEHVMAALGKVQEPELHRDLVSLGMIKDLAIDGGKVSFSIQLTTPACPLRSQIEREARQAVEAVPGVAQVAIKMI